MPFDTRRWVDPSQPQTLQFACWLLYANAIIGLLFGGSVGNLTDRMVREPGPGRGHVVDFIDYFGLFIGNVADIAIVGAAVLIGLLALRGISVDGSRPEPGRHEAGHEATHV